jgi:hypothetical protein
VDNNIIRCVRCRTCSGFLKVSSRVVCLHVFVSCYVVGNKVVHHIYQMNSCSTEESKNNEIYFQLAVLRAWWACCQSQARSSSCLFRSSLPSALHLFLSSIFLSCSNSLQVCLCTLSLLSCFLVNFFSFSISPFHLYIHYFSLTPTYFVGSPLLFFSKTSSILQYLNHHAPAS